MADVKVLGGVAQLRIGDTVLLFREGLKHNFQKYEKKGVMGRDTILHGKTLTPKVPFVEGEFSHDGSLSTKDYEALSGDLVAAQFDGSTIVLRNAFVAGDIEIDDDDGKVKLRFEGASGEELPA